MYVLYFHGRVPPSNVPPWLTTLVPRPCIRRTILPWHILFKYVCVYTLTATGCYDLEIRGINSPPTPGSSLVSSSMRSYIVCYHCRMQEGV